MPQCKASDTLTATTLRAEADPCPWTAGFTAPNHMVSIRNNRSSALYNVDLLSKSLFGLTELDGKPDIIKHHTKISGRGGSKQHSHSLTATSGSSGQTEEVSTTATYNDETQRTVEEKMHIIYDIDVP